MHIWCYNIKNYCLKNSKKNGVSTVFKLMVKLSPHLIAIFLVWPIVKTEDADLG